MQRRGRDSTFSLLSVFNESSQEELSIRDVRILPNLNASYLPMMPDGSVLLVDNVWYVAVASLLSRLLPVLTLCVFAVCPSATNRARSAWRRSAGWTA